MPKYLAALFALALLCLASAISGGALAQTLPQELAQRIGVAAEQGRQHQAALSDIIDERRQGANRQLETVVISAINQHPDLFQSIMQEAHRQAPESRVSLNQLVGGMFPGFAGTLRATPQSQESTQALPKQVEESRAAEKAIHDARAPPMRFAAPSPSLEERPADWPILTREGGIDGYADKDPLELLNKVFFYTNGALDFIIFEPLARGYRFIGPVGLRHALGRAFNNLSSPITFANDLLQFRFRRAATTFSRFAINSTTGVLGLFDVAADLGLEGHDADFGQTLHYYGVGDGIYLVLPLFGPTTMRDAIGIGVDSLLDPRSWFIGSAERYALFAAEGVVRREKLIDAIDFLIDHSDATYEDVRAWSFQQRERELWEECQRRTHIVCSAR